MAVSTPPFPNGPLEALCRELAETANGTQITHLMRQARLPDSSGESTKWKRLFYSIGRHQERSQSGKALIAIIHAFMAPGRWTSDKGGFEHHRARLNTGLALAGFELGSDGRVARLDNRALTLDEAEERADRLGTELKRRRVHSDVLAFCRTELLQANYFHAVLEACKSVADKVRTRTGLVGDGEELFGPAFSLRDNVPPLAFNRLQDSWERSEHTGLATLIRGVHQTYRNPTAHAPSVRWATDLDEALDLLTLVSMLHRRLDDAEVTPAAPAHPHHHAQTA